MGSNWLYSSCFVGCGVQDLLKTVRKVLAYFFLFFSKRFVRVLPENLYGKFYHLEYSDYCFQSYGYTYDVSADASFGLLQVFHVELESLHGTSK